MAVIGRISNANSSQFAESVARDGPSGNRSAMVASAEQSAGAEQPCDAAKQRRDRGQQHYGKRGAASPVQQFGNLQADVLGHHQRLAAAENRGNDEEAE